MFNVSFKGYLRAIGLLALIFLGLTLVGLLGFLHPILPALTLMGISLLLIVYLLAGILDDF